MTLRDVICCVLTVCFQASSCVVYYKCCLIFHFFIFLNHPPAYFCVLGCVRFSCDFKRGFTKCFDRREKAEDSKGKFKQSQTLKVLLI